GALSTKAAYTLPLMIDAIITGNDRPLTLGYSNRPLSGWGMHHYGFISNYDWAKKPGDFVVKDVYVNYGMDYDRTIPSASGDETEVSWIIHRDYMAVLVNGQVVHYCENMPYMHFDVPAMPVRIGSVDGIWAKVKSLTVTELE
ncbi:MAG: hypothetical protein J6I45_07780, partial [Clostridia bacterium]|nr:hypothetical protein [Clostridia bacterium]